MGDDAVPTDAVARSSLAVWYELDETREDKVAEDVLEALTAAPTGGRASLTDTLISGPNLFVPLGPEVKFRPLAQCPQSQAGSLYAAHRSRQRAVVLRERHHGRREAVNPQQQEIKAAAPRRSPPRPGCIGLVMCERVASKQAGRSSKLMC